MSAPTNNQNAKGNKGGKGNPTVQDREASKRVRSLTLEKIEEILSQPIVKMKHDDYDLYKAILIKLAGSVLPRLSEVSGEDGGPIELKWEK